MIFISKKSAAAAPPGGSVGPLVTFDGTSDYITGISGLTTSSTLTVAGRLVFNGNPVALDTVFSFFYSGMRFSDATNPRQVQLDILNSGFSSIVNAEDGTTWDDTDTMAFVVAIDLAGGLSGSKSVSMYINGSEVISSTTTGGTLAFNSDEPFTLMGINSGGRLVSADTNGFWVSTSAVDPQSYYSDFFDGSHQWQALSNAGTVQGVTPEFWQNGDATAWNSGSDNNSNSYTMNGSVA